MSVLNILIQLVRLIVAVITGSKRSGWAHLPANTEPNRSLPEVVVGPVEALPSEPMATPAAPVVVMPSADPTVVSAPDFRSRIVDRRTLADQKHVYGKRDWSKVTGICLHQTACVLGERPGRWDTIGCHVGVTRGGQVIWLHDFNKLVVHGNQWNSQTVGIEIDGMYEGVEGDIKTFWRPKDQPNLQPQRPTDVQIEAVCDLVRFIHSEVARNGGQIKALVSHRQASENRRNDPGSAIWKRVALPMSAELGLNDGGPGFKLSTGYPNPESWDPTRKGYRY